MLVFETPVPIRRAGMGVQVFLPGDQPRVYTPRTASSPPASVLDYDGEDLGGNARVLGLSVPTASALSETARDGAPADTLPGVCTLYLPPPDVMPHLQFDCSGLLRVFSPEALLGALAALAMERRVVVVARSVAALVSTCESLLGLLFPLQFDFPYIPVLPVSGSDGVIAAILGRVLETSTVVQAVRLSGSCSHRSSTYVVVCRPTWRATVSPTPSPSCTVCWRPRRAALLRTSWKATSRR